jgi:hypothetical protein
MDAPERYAPTREFPPYAFLPGKDPHPTRDPRGHSFGHDETPPELVAMDAWRDNEDYLYGVDLYNAGFLWEAHEAWEGLWHPAKELDPEQAEFLQGLIQCAAAALKIRMEQPRGLARLSELGTGRLAGVAARCGDEVMGLDVAGFVDEFRAFAAGAAPSVDDRPRIRLAR